MKQIYRSVLRCNGNTIAKTSGTKLTIFQMAVCLLIVVAFFSSCKKDGSQSVDEQQTESGISSAKVVNQYVGLSKQTMFELQMAKAATSKYQNIKQALNDGYEDIAVDVEHMGHHYMKKQLANDIIFDPQTPEILVYNKNERGQQELVAVEYAVPISLTNTVPEGFTGNNDVWDRNTTFGLWLLHAWVYAYNPLGVFNPTNPNVHLH